MNGILRKTVTKRTLYFLCFMAFNLIEFLRATAAENVWSAAANCTGLVMMVIVFSALPVSELLRPKYYIWSALCAVALLSVCLYWTLHKGEFYLGQSLTAVLNIWWLGLAVHYFWRQFFEEKNLAIRPGVTGILWIALTAWTVVSVANSWWPVWFLFMFGVFYLVKYREEDRVALINGMIDGTILSFFIIQGWAYLFRPYDELRYKGAFSNCNAMALYYLIVYTMVLFKLHLLYEKKAKWGWKLFYFVGAGGLLGFQFLTLCRTMWITSIAVTICYGVIVFRKCRGEKWGKIIARGCALALCMALTFPAVFLTVRWLPTIHPHPVWHDGEWSKKKVHSWDPADSPKYVDWDEFWEGALGRFYSIANAANRHNPLVLKASAKENHSRIFEDDYKIYMDDYSWTESTFSQRLVYCKYYLKYSGWFGNPSGRGIAFPDVERRPWHAQNIWVQFTYVYGYPAGILMLFLAPLVLIQNARRARGIKRDPYAVIPVTMSVLYFVCGMSEAVWIPGQLALTLLFFVAHPQFAAATASRGAEARIRSAEE